MRAAVFLTFCSGTLLKWKSATAAALTTMPAGARFSNTFSRISAAVRTGISSTPGGGGFGQRIAHLAAGTVGDVAHRVEGLLGGAGGDQHGLAFQVLPSARFALNGFHDGRGGGQPAGAGHAARQVDAV